MRIFCRLIFLLLFVYSFIPAQVNWPQTKATTTLQVAIPSEFGMPLPQPLSVNGWEDGIFITRDGLHLYCIYLPLDALSWTLNGAPCHFAPYQKGPLYGMNFTTTPVPACSTWMHGDVLYASRASTNQPFTAWNRTNLGAPVFSEGAPQLSLNSNTLADLFVYTSNAQPPYKTDIRLIRNEGINPVTTGSLLPFPVTDTTTEDNPHIERLSASQLVLFFDSPDRPGASGGLDLWVTQSNNDGLSWSVPLPVNSLNTTLNEHQPHLYKDALNNWWMYYTAPDQSGKYAIYRAQQTISNNWDSWGPKQMVLGPGNSAGIGEPTLTQNGDLSFVVVHQDPNGSSTDKFDADPWFLPKVVTTGKAEQITTAFRFSVYPNPSRETLVVKSTMVMDRVRLILKDLSGRERSVKEWTGREIHVERNGLETGVYLLCVDDADRGSFHKLITFVD